MLILAAHLRLGAPSNHLQDLKGAVASSDMIINSKLHEKYQADSEVIRGWQTQGHRHVAQ